MQDIQCCGPFGKLTAVWWNRLCLGEFRFEEGPGPASPSLPVTKPLGTRGPPLPPACKPCRHLIPDTASPSCPAPPGARAHADTSLSCAVCPLLTGRVPPAIGTFRDFVAGEHRPVFVHHSHPPMTLCRPHTCEVFFHLIASGTGTLAPALWCTGVN